MDWLNNLEAPLVAALSGGNYALALALVFLAGVATSLTPCVYPMIAITVSVFGAREAKSRMHGAGLSLLFVLGIALLFTPLGIASAMTGSVFGALLANPYLLAGLATLFLVLALSMFGAFELSLPPALQNRLAKMGGVGPKGALALGLTSGLIAAPCTGPVLAFLLAWIGTTGNVAFGGAALFVYSLGLGLLFFLVGTFAITLPKSGRWLEWIKSLFGIVMVVMALYYVRDLLPLERPVERTETWIGAGLIMTVLGVALGAIHLSFHGAGAMARLRKGTGISLAVLGVTAALWWAEALPPGTKMAWLHDYEEATTLAQATGRPLLVDFGASWCAACGELDRDTFSDPRVVAEAHAKDFIPVRVDLSPDQDSPEKRKILASYDHKGLPLVVIHDRQGKEVGRVTSFVDAEEFLGVLRRVD